MPHFPKDSGFTSKDASSAQTAVTVKNRRKRYLDLHPEYFSAGLELADPLLYDRLIRRFQTTQEREAEGRAKGFSGVLETDLMRSEAKMDAISHPDPNAMMSYTRGPDGEILAEDRDEIPPNKEEGERLWRWEMGLRFMQGNDSDFDYKTVDQNDDYDDHTDEQDQYFEDEEPEWVVDGTRGDDARPNLQGETGIQDF
ncbi:Protein of unknown function DUF2052, coiled-coil [Penicillium expansum]|uniref:CCD97-like C-terminal domain-containing protein n=1 Tax=Penicillium expansum TaxID=27334 RepID=A0A0A2KY71_PENEN|nr:Protein of unknown function DUF2052, coiled-coil [Penicillium expansum]KAJ5518255.1 hypothetical protein N7453_000677 [Penicillium expansum]KGO35994.1 Protein of unknown function DUF2052, coiled-coil [Penicillium expansum]KGO59316.1 Protein of unknown function DUF2052, coiled-coil [Penicillium expansum]KGO71888.1 Protein of unknown function DUF2052, coiled-coil [Penicillium expansum]